VLQDQEKALDIPLMTFKTRTSIDFYKISHLSNLDALFRAMSFQDNLIATLWVTVYLVKYVVYVKATEYLIELIVGASDWLFSEAFLELIRMIFEERIRFYERLETQERPPLAPAPAGPRPMPRNPNHRNHGG
jgi:hypothetical protein